MFIFWKQSLWDLHPLRAVSAWMCWWGCVRLACVGRSSSVSDFPFTTAPPLGFWKEHSVLAKGYEQPWQPEPALPAQSFVQGNWKINFLKGETWNACEETRKIRDRGKGRSKGKRNNEGNVKNKGKPSFLNRKMQKVQNLPSRPHFFEWNWLGAWNTFLVLICLLTTMPW